MSRLPRGWMMTTVAEAGSVTLGRQRHPDWHHGQHMRPYLRVANVFEDRIDVADVMEMDFPPPVFERFKLIPGDILLNEGQSPHLLGRPAMYKGIPSDVAFTNSLIRFRASDNVAPAWALLVFRHYMHSGRFLEEVRITTNIAHLSASRFKNIEFPVPPLNEQKRIVAAFDAYFTKLDWAQQSVSVASRRLTALARTRCDLLESMSDTEMVPLDTLIREPLRNGHSGRQSRTAEGVRTLTLTAVTRRTFSDAFTKITDTPPEKAAGLWLEDGDIFVQRSNTPDLVGSAAIFHGPEHWSIFPDLLIRVRPDRSRVEPDYLCLVLQSRRVRDYFRRSARGLAGSMPKIGQSVIGKVEVPIVSIARQRELVARVAELDAELDRIGQAVTVAKTRSAALRRGVLRAAFNGELVDQDPTDEPAEIFLSRIRAEREGAGSTARTPRARKVKT